MITLLMTLTLVALAMLAMAVGLILAGKRLRGSCGGAECHCLAEGADPKTCDRGARLHSTTR